MSKKTMDELIEIAMDHMDFHLWGVNSSMSEDAINEDVGNGIDYSIECLYDEHLTETEKTTISTMLEEQYDWRYVLRVIFKIKLGEDENGKTCVWRDDEKSGGGSWISIHNHCAGCYNTYDECDCYCKDCGVNKDECDC